MMCICIILYTLLVPLSYSVEIHQHWIDDDIQDQIQTPDYQLISVKNLIKKRSINELSINVKLNGTDRVFVLQSTEGYFAGKDTRIWEAERIGNNFKYTLKEGIMEKINITFYQDDKTKSVVSHTVNKRGISDLNGIINSNIIIHPVNHLVRKRRNAETNYDNIDNYHVIYKRDSASVYDNDKNEESVEKTESPKSETVDIVYPEILVFVDISLYERFQMDIEKTVAYTLTLFNGVDLYYRDVKEPLVRLNIAGIVLCRNQSFFQTNKGALSEFSNFLYNETNFKMGIDYDIVALIGFYNYSNNPGIAYMSSACENDTLYHRIKSLFIFFDDTQFSGIDVAAHELGHVLGAGHDGNAKYIIDSSEKFEEIFCPEDEGYLMMPKIGGKNQFHFSSCSKREMSFFLSLNKTKCLRNNPADHRDDEQMLRILPGKLSSLDEKCKEIGFLRAATATPIICYRINCIDQDNCIRSQHIPAPEGTSCDVNKFCLRGECVEVPFDETYKNLGLNKYFPPYLQLPGTNKSVEKECKEEGIMDCTYGKCVLQSSTSISPINELTTLTENISSDDVIIHSKEDPVDNSNDAKEQEDVTTTEYPTISI